MPKWVLDEAPEGSSGSVKTSSTLEGLSGFIDGQISPIEDPDWTYSIWIESGENNLPSFKMVNDTQEVIVDGRLHLQGWKYRIVELGMDQLKQIRDRSGGRLTFKIVTPGGIPTPGTLLADYFHVEEERSRERVWDDSCRQTESGNFTTDGLPIAVPGTGTLGIPTVFSGAVREQRSKDALFRPDERLIVTEFNNLTIDTGKNFEVIDISEAGELHSIVIVSDNPYLQVFLQIDDFRNAEPHGLTVAELLFNGDVTQTSQRRFKAVDGQSPTVGYAMVFEPQQPVQYTDRLRIIVYNNIPANPNVYGKDLGFRNSATLPTPAAPAHGGCNL